MAPRSSEPLDPALRAKLLQESRSPWRGLRRALWVALAASAALGLATMAMRASAGGEVPGSDLLIQVVALAVFGGLLLVDRHRHRGGNGPVLGGSGLDRD